MVYIDVHIFYGVVLLLCVSPRWQGSVQPLLVVWLAVNAWCVCLSSRLLTRGTICPTSVVVGAPSVTPMLGDQHIAPLASDCLGTLV